MAFDVTNRFFKSLRRIRLLALIEGYRKTDGFTLAASGQFLNPQHGFAVGIREFKTPESLVNFVLEYPQYHIGFWRDAESGREYFDAVEIVQNRFDALVLAANHGQKAIFDFSSGESVYLDAVLRGREAAA